MSSDYLSTPPFTPIWARDKETKYFIYNGISMVPLFKPGDMLCVKPSPFFDIHKGDIIVFSLISEANEHSSIVHRVISLSHNGLITKGDNNAKPDIPMVNMDNLSGLVTFFERQGQLFPVRGGALGMFHARVIDIQNFILRLIKHLGWQTYHWVGKTGLVARMWKPEIVQVCVSSDEGPLVKYCHGTKTVARWWPQQKHFDVVKPYDLVILHLINLK